MDYNVNLKSSPFSRIPVKKKKFQERGILRLHHVIQQWSLSKSGEHQTDMSPHQGECYRNDLWILGFLPLDDTVEMVER